MNIIECFERKIKEFESHKEYQWLKQEAKKAKRAYCGYGLEAIIYEDFIERIVAMPNDYILAWLDNRNELKWRECDKKMIDAIKGGYVHLLEKYKNHSIHHIGIGAVNFYKTCGYEIIYDDDNVFAVKEQARCELK